MLGDTAPLVVLMSNGAVGDALEVADMLDVTTMLVPKHTDFKKVMTAHAKESLDEMNQLIMMKLNTTLAKPSSLQQGDIKTLKLVMGADSGANRVAAGREVETGEGRAKTRARVGSQASARPRSTRTRARASRACAT